MAIKYYPNRVYKGKVPAIDRVMAKRKIQVASGHANLAAAALSTVISCENDWQLDTIQFNFSNATPRNFNAYIKNGRKVVENLNDYLWFQSPNSFPQKIILTAGFYSGTELAAQLKAKLDANVAFAALGMTFTITYTAATGLFLITPSTNTIAYLDVNTSAVMTIRDSIAGHLFGLNVTTTPASSITSDTAVFGLNTETAVVSQAASTASTYLRDTVDTLSIDQAVKLTTNTGSSVLTDYIVTYEEIV